MDSLQQKDDRRGSSLLTEGKRMFGQILNNSTYRNDISQFVYYVIGYGMVLVFSYVLNVLINKILSTDELGMYSYVQGLINILAPVLCLAFYNAYLRFHQDHFLPEALLKFGLPFYLFSVLVCGIVVAVITKSCLAILYAMTVFFVEKQYILRVQMQIWKLNVLRLMELAVPCLFLVCARHWQWEVRASYLFFFYGIGFCSAFLFASKSKTNNNPIRKKEVMWYLIPAVGTSFLTFFLLNAGVLFAKKYYGLPGAAEWGVAARIVMCFKSFTSLFLMFFPMIYFREAEKNHYRIIHFYRMGIVLMAIFVCIPFILFPNFFYWLFGAEKYTDSSILMVLLITAELLNFIAGLYCLFFNFEIKTWKNTILKAVNLILFLVGIILFVRQGLSFIAWSYLVSVIVYLVCAVLFGFVQERVFFANRKVSS